MKENLELYVLNQTKSDVSISDLGVKVPAGKAINIYKSNPYLTPEQVEKSKKEGALFKRLSGESPVLKIIKKISAINSSIVMKLKETEIPVQIKKTKSSIVIEMPAVEDDPTQENLDFADYGIIDEPKANMVKEQASVFIKAKEDHIKEEKPVIEIKPTNTSSNISKQSTIVMEVTSKNLVSPLADIVPNESPTMSFVVSKLKEDAKEANEQIIEIDASKVVVEDGTIKVAAKKDPKNKKAKFNTVRRTDGELIDDPFILEDINLGETQNPTKVSDMVIVESKQKTEK